MEKAFFVVADDDGDFSITADTVLEDEEPEDTGLLDQYGNPLIRVRQPIGFDLTRRR